jgi:hypothetical protein
MPWARFLKATENYQPGASRGAAGGTEHELDEQRGLDPSGVSKKKLGAARCSAIAISS